MLWLLVSFILGGVQVTGPAHLKPGALVGHLGRMALVEDVLWVKYPYGTLASIPSRLEELLAQVDACLTKLDLDVLQNVTIMEDTSVLTIFKNRVAYVNDSIALALSAYLDVDVAA